jgi:DeoR/GlpR family transcriptional regulator of sugar metabolism
LFENGKAAFERESDKDTRRLRILVHMIRENLATESELSEVADAHGGQLGGDLRYLERIGFNKTGLRKTGLERTGYVRRLPAGRVVSLVPAWPSPGFTGRLDTHTSEKWHIAQAARKLIREGETIFLGPGGTCFLLAVEIHEHIPRNLRVVTSALYFLHILVPKVSEVRLLGGPAKKEGMETLVTDARSVSALGLGEHQFDTAFLGVTGLSIERGIRCSASNCELQRHACSTARRVIILADHSKLNASVGETFATFEELKGRGKALSVVIDPWEPVNQEERRSLAELKELLGPRLIVAEVKNEGSAGLSLGQVSANE